MKIEPGAPIEFGLSGIKTRIEKLNKIKRFNFSRGVDFGAGQGAYSLELIKENFSIVPFDINYENLSKVNSKLNAGNVKPVVTSAMNAGFKNESFDAAFVIEVLEHLEDLGKGLKELYRIMKSNSFIYVTVPNKYFLLETHLIILFGKNLKGRYFPFISMFDFIHNKIGTARRFSKKKLIEIFENNGFIPIGFDYMMPPFDNFKTGKILFGKLTRWIEKSPFNFLSTTLVAVFQKN
jgi:SAM-dependent methyltransferase